MKYRATLLLLFILLLSACGSEGPAGFSGVWTYDDAATRKENAQPLGGLREKMFWDLVAKTYKSTVITIDVKSGTLSNTKGAETLSGPVRLEGNSLIWTPEPGREQRYTLTKEGLLEIEAGGRVLLFKK